jgi:hypothetical protein
MKKNKKIPYYLIIGLKFFKLFKKDKKLAKLYGWTIDYGFGTDSPHFHTPWGNLYWKDY